MRISPGRARILGLTANVFFLGMVSFLTDISSEMTLTLLPLFLANVLGTSTVVIGLIEGVAESAASLLKIGSGWFSDRWQQRKILTVIGYGLSTVSKPFLFFASTWHWVLGVRFADRLGKGVRTSPRDALLADSTTEKERGKSFGFHRAMDSFGAVLGLGLAALIVYLTQKGAVDITQASFQRLVLMGIIPAVLAVLVIIFFVHESKEKKDKIDPPVAREIPKSKTSGLFAGLPTRFKIFLGIMVLFTLGNSSDAFLILRAQNIGLSTFHILLLLVTFNIVYALIAGPAGVLSDKVGRKALIIGGWTVYALIYLGFGMASTPWVIVGLFIAYGIYYGTAEGVGRALVADMVPAEKRGTAYGLYHGAVGISVLPASVIAGWLWQSINPAAPFFFGAALAAIASIGLVTLVK